jgi:uncharacterized membrane protein
MLLRALAGTALLYLASIGVVEVFQSGAASVGDGLAPGFAQEGQVALSTLWALTGAMMLVVGLSRGVRVARLAGLGLLALAGGKVAVVDLSALDSLYRVVSFVGLGLLLLGSAFAYQRLRPELPEGAPDA